MSNEPAYRDAETLRELYYEKEMSLSEIADHLDCGQTTVADWMDRHDIERRDGFQESSDVQTELLEDKEWLRQKYHKEGLTLKEVGEICNCADSTVRYWMQNHDMDTDSKSESFTDGDVAKLQDEEWLSEQYHDKDKSQKQIADELGLSQSAVYKYMKRHDMESKRLGWHNVMGNIEKLDDEEWLREQYVDNENSQMQIAKKLGISQQSVGRYMEKYGIESRLRGWHLTDGDHKKLHDREYLETQYVENGKSTPKIANELDLSPGSVISALERHNIERRHGTPSGEDHWLAKPNQKSNGKYYGPNWNQQRKKALIRDQGRCQRCGITDAKHNRDFDQDLEVHHIKNRRKFIDDEGVLDYESANDLDNLVTLCLACHRKVEALPLNVDVR